MPERNGIWRRLVARFTGGEEVAGSNPVIPTRVFPHAPDPIPAAVPRAPPAGGRGRGHHRDETASRAEVGSRLLGGKNESTGTSSACVERSLREREAGGSNPPYPTQWKSQPKAGAGRGLENRWG